MARRILFIILGVILALVAIVAIAGFFFVRTPFPDTDGKVQVPDAAAIAQSLPEAGETLQFSTLQSPVTVYRDEYGVPQIYADNLHDLFFAQGYVQAQDRLFQMDFQRRVGTGTLSEVLGEATLETDRFLRTLGTGRAAAKDLEVMSQETLSDLQAYADGVNAFISANQDSLPLEFRILGYKPQPWEPLHSVVWGKMMAWNLGGNWETELMRARLLDTMGAEKTADLSAALSAVWSLYHSARGQELRRSGRHRFRQGDGGEAPAQGHRSGHRQQQLGGSRQPHHHR